MLLTQEFPITDLVAEARSGIGTRFRADGVLVEDAGNALRPDWDPATGQFRGLLIEPEGTNLFPYSRGEGAVAGTPGAPPPGWAVAGSAAGITRQFLGSLAVDGIPGFAVRYSGTSGNANFAAVGVADGIAAAAGQIVTVSWYQQLLAGSLWPAPGFFFRWNERAGSTVLTTGQTAYVPPAPDPPRLQRISVTRTLAQPATDNILPEIGWFRPNGVPIDVTLFVGGLQVEFGSAPGSLTLPPAGAPASAVRGSALVAATQPGRWLNPAEGTFVAEFVPGQENWSEQRALIRLDDGSSDNVVFARMLGTNTNVRLSATVAAAAGATVDKASGPALARHVLRFSYGGLGYWISIDGGAPGNAAGAVPAGLSRVLFGCGPGTTGRLAGWLGPRIAYYPRQYVDVPAADGLTIRDR